MSITLVLVQFISGELEKETWQGRVKVNRFVGSSCDDHLSLSLSLCRFYHFSSSSSLLFFLFINILKKKKKKSFISTTRHHLCSSDWPQGNWTRHPGQFSLAHHGHTQTIEWQNRIYLSVWSASFSFRSRLIFVLFIVVVVFCWHLNTTELMCVNEHEYERERKRQLDNNSSFHLTLSSLRSMGKWGKDKTMNEMWLMRN